MKAARTMRTRTQSFPYDQKSAFVRACILLVFENILKVMSGCLLDREEGCLLGFFSSRGCGSVD